MTPEVQAILELQDIDLKMIKSKSELKELEQKNDIFEKDKLAIKNSLSQVEEEIKALSLTQSKLNGDVESLKEKSNKLETQLNAIKTNKEYTAMLSEIERAKKEIISAEDRVLEIMEELELKNLEKEENNKACKEKTAQVDEAIKANQQDIATINNNLEKFVKDRKDISTKCSGDLFTRYEKFFLKKNTIGLVPLHENGACGGCHQILPPNTKNDVMKGRIVVCDNCTRLIFWQKQEETPKEEN